MEEISARIQGQISKSENYNEALKKSLHTVVNAGVADHVVVWYLNPDEEYRLYVYFSISPLDMTDLCYDPADGLLGRVVRTQRAAVYEKRDWFGRRKTSARMQELNASRLAVVPIGKSFQKIGCIEFIRTDKENKFSERDILLFRSIPEWVCRQFAVALPKGRRKKKTVISVRNVKKSFRSGEVVTNVLKGVNFNVYKGEFLCLLGESGCGKTTTLNMIGGMDKIDEGTFTFMGKNFSKASQKELTEYRRNNIGFIFQSYNLMPNLTVKQNLELISELVNHPRNPVAMLRLVGMAGKKDNYPSQLSGGQQQRVSIARALVKDPKVILADEPTAALDYATSIEVLSAIEDVLKTGTTLVMVTHNEEITKMADRVIRFRDGKTYEITVNQKKVKAKELVW